MKRQEFVLLLDPSLVDEAGRLAARDGVQLSQFINTALAEKLSVVLNESFFRERAARADLPGAIQILKSAGRGNDPDPEDAF